MSYQRITILLFVFLYPYFNGKGQTFELYQSDTINRADQEGTKYGRWISFYDGDKLRIEKEGFYEKGRKTGLWKAYYENGILKSEINYVNNNPDGYARMYYKDGKISEEGTWKVTKWVGKYLYYHENGNKAYEWNFNQEGKRTGEQKYYHENGQLRIKGDWTDGKENGVITEYDPSGNIKSEKLFANGAFDEKGSKFYAVKKVSVDEIPDVTNATSDKKNDNTKNTENSYETFTGTGNFRLYNSFKKIDREGEFKDGKLVTGKKYYYNPDGKLIKTEVYTNSKITEIIR